MLCLLETVYEKNVQDVFHEFIDGTAYYHIKHQICQAI